MRSKFMFSRDPEISAGTTNLVVVARAHAVPERGNCCLRCCRQALSLVSL